jgi:hypothetical protein
MRYGFMTMSLAVFVAAGTEALAQETMCGGLTGEGRGLCNAYCEAMDCDSAAPKASAEACTNVRTRFETVTSAPPPCAAPPVACPCNFDVNLWTDPHWLFTRLNVPWCEVSSDDTRLFSPTIMNDPSFGNVAGVLLEAVVRRDKSGNINRQCGAAVPGDWFLPEVTRAYEAGQVFGLTAEQHAECVVDIKAIAQALGRPCPE